MKACVLIPVYNHAASLPEVVRGAQAYCPVIVVDDGSTDQPVAPESAVLVRLPENQGKGAALRVGFAKALELGYTHAITMDADGQHFAEDIPKFLEAIPQHPEALLVGVRDFVAAGAPAGRRRSNKISSFWFRAATGAKLGDTQCGFRCYPLESVLQLRIKAARYAFELETLARAGWSGMPLIPVPVGVRYAPELVRGSHFRPVVDFLRITNLQAKLVLQAWLLPAELRAFWAKGQNRTKRQITGSFFREHAQYPYQLASAVGLGLFCGIAPFWGFQMAAAIAGANYFRLNKAISVLASNISFPLLAPFIVYASLVIGHWLRTGERLRLSAHDVTMQHAFQYFGAWFLGSFVLATAAAVVGTLVTYLVARVLWRSS